MCCCNSNYEYNSHECEVSGTDLYNLQTEIDSLKTMLFHIFEEMGYNVHISNIEEVRNFLDEQRGLIADREKLALETLIRQNETQITALKNCWAQKIKRIENERSKTIWQKRIEKLDTLDVSKPLQEQVNFPLRYSY